MEHQPVSFISRNWRGRRLIDHQTIVEMTGLTVRCGLDRTAYPADVKISDADMSKIIIIRDRFHGE